MKKLVSRAELLKIANKLRAQGKKIAWTNGCFDIMHAGHVDYLEKARDYGDALVVGLNSDQSIKALKGNSRPICSQEQRAKVLNALCCVDYILIFDDKSPLNIIRELKPEFYIKGGDYTIDTIDQNERRSVEDYGGEIIILPEVKGISTTFIVEQIKKLN